MNRPHAQHKQKHNSLYFHDCHYVHQNSLAFFLPATNCSPLTTAYSPQYTMYSPLSTVLFVHTVLIAHYVQSSDIMYRVLQPAFH